MDSMSFGSSDHDSQRISTMRYVELVCRACQLMCLHRHCQSGHLQSTSLLFSFFFGIIDLAVISSMRFNFVFHPRCRCQPHYPPRYLCQTRCHSQVRRHSQTRQHRQPHFPYQPRHLPPVSFDIILPDTLNPAVIVNLVDGSVSDLGERAFKTSEKEFPECYWSRSTS